MIYVYLKERDINLLRFSLLKVIIVRSRTKDYTKKNYFSLLRRTHRPRSWYCPFMNSIWMSRKITLFHSFTIIVIVFIIIPKQFPCILGSPFESYRLGPC